MAGFINITSGEVPQIRIHNDEDMTYHFFTEGVSSQDSYFGSYSQSSSGESNYYPSSESQGLLTSYGLNNNNQCLPVLDPLDLDESLMSVANMPTSHFLTGSDVALPYELSPTTESSSGLYSPADNTLSPAGSLLQPSPASSYNGLSSPASYYSDAVCLSDIESSSPVTPDEPNHFFPTESFSRRGSASSATRPPFHHHHSSSISAIPSSDFLHAPSAHHRSNSMPSTHRPRSVASPAMLDANSRRRRHPATFTCELCHQTFTALFSLKRHQQSHTGERPYQCRVPGCEQRFFNSSDCKRHERSKKRHKDLPGYRDLPI